MRPRFDVLAVLAALAAFLPVSKASDIALPEIQVKWVPGLLGGTLMDIARQAGVAIQWPVDVATFQRHNEKGTGPFSEALPALVSKYLPGWTWSFDGATVTLQQPPSATTPPPMKEQGSPAKGSADKPTYWLLAGDEVVAEGELPHFAPAMVVDGSIAVLDNVINLQISPLGPACLVGQKDIVCLRVLNPNDRGEVSIQLDGKQYKVRYTVDAEALVLYRYSLHTVNTKGDTSRVNPYPPSTPPSPSTSTPPPAARITATAASTVSTTKRLNDLGGGPWVYSPHGLYEWRGLKLNKANPKDTWWQIGTYQSVSSLLKQIAQLDKHRIAPMAVYQRSNGVLVLLVGTSPNVANAIYKLGLSAQPFP